MNKKTLLWIAAALAAGLTAGYLISGMQRHEEGAMQQATGGDGPCPGGTPAVAWRNPMNPAITSPTFTQDEMGMDYLPICAEAEKKILFYRNPMNPAITSPVPAKDEMGMDYIPVYASADQGADASAGTVRIDPVTTQNIGVRTTVAKQKTLTRDIRTVGRVDFDEKRVARLHPKVEGWVEKLFVDSTGQQVKKDTMLLAIYSPQLVSSEEEYLLALNNAETLKNSPFPDIRDGASSLAHSARERLKLLDVPEHQLMELESRKKIIKNLHIHSPFDGVVIDIGVREGQFVTPGSELYTIADLSRIWVYIDIYEDELPWVQAGDVAEMRLPAVPGRVFTGKVSYIYPYLDAKTRTNKVRIEFANPDGALKPDMYANITIRASRRVDAVVVPSEAIVRTGSHEQLFVQRAPGKFEPRRVKLGLTADGEVQVLEGVAPGELVVTSSQFLIDSESKLKEATAKMLEASQQAPGHEEKVDAEGMSMEEMSMEGMEMPAGSQDMNMDSMQMPDDPSAHQQQTEHGHDHH